MVLRWKMVRQVVTKEGASMRAEAVRSWLKDRKYKVADSTEVSIDMGDGVVLKTATELQGLLEYLECQTVDFTSAGHSAKTGRTAARGKSQNTNSGDLKLDFLNASGARITSASLDHGAIARIKLRLSPAPADVPMTLELSWIGAKLRSRNAIRSVIGPSSGYRYLSRVRVAAHVDGIREPLSDLTKKFIIKAVPTRPKIAHDAILAEYTLMGLEAEHGREKLQALLFGKDGKLLALAVLAVDVGTTKMLGSYKMLEHASAADFLTADVQFNPIYSVAPAPAAEVRAGICDTGIVDDSAGSSYLDARWAAGRFFGSPLAESVDTPNLDRQDRSTKPDETNARHILLDEPSKHGTNVAGHVAWGTAKIKLVDIMVQKGQMAGAFPDSTASRALAWGCTQNVSVVNCSKHAPWSERQTSDTGRSQSHGVVPRHGRQYRRVLSPRSLQSSGREDPRRIQRRRVSAAEF